jgi:hypothetical protein
MKGVSYDGHGLKSKALSHSGKSKTAPAADSVLKVKNSVVGLPQIK